MEEVIDSYASLREYASLNPWFPSLITGMMSNWINYLKKERDITSKLDNLTNSEALEIGEALAKALDAGVTAEAGVDHWILQYPSMKELCKREKFFLPFVVTIGKRKLIEAPWGLLLRVSVGAFLSFMDSSTNVSTVYFYLKQGRTNYAAAQIAIILLCMSFQMIIVHIQHGQKPTRILLREYLFVVLLIRPMIEVYRVSTITDKGDLESLDPITEMLAGKTSRMFAESIRKFYRGIPFYLSTLDILS